MVYYFIASSIVYFIIYVNLLMDYDELNRKNFTTTLDSGEATIRIGIVAFMLSIIPIVRAIILIMLIQELRGISNGRWWRV